MFRITEFTEDTTGALVAPHLYITLTGRGDLDLGPVSPALLAELTAAAEATTDQYADMAAAWANTHGNAICLGLAVALEEAGCTDLVYAAQTIRFIWHGAQFELVRRGIHLELTWEYPVVVITHK